MVKWKRQGAKLCVEYCHVYGRNTERLYRDTPVERVCACVHVRVCAVPGEMHKKPLLVVPGEETGSGGGRYAKNTILLPTMSYR